MCVHINMYYVPIHDTCFLFQNQREKGKKNWYSLESYYLEIAIKHLKNNLQVTSVMGTCTRS